MTKWNYVLTYVCTYNSDKSIFSIILSNFDKMLA